MRLPLKTVVNYRPCGECQACCTAVGIKELHKPAYQRCEHQCDKGCAIYEDRPETCRGYSCLWAAGILDGDERRRPDKLGVIFDFRNLSGSEHVRPGDKVAVQAWEVWPGAMNGPQANYLIQRIAEKFQVMVIEERVMNGGVSAHQ